MNPSAHQFGWRHWCNVADTAVRFGRWAEAATALERAAKLNPADPAIARNLGFAFSKLGRLEEALAVLRTAVGLEPDSVQGRLSYAQVLIDLGHSSDALVEMEKGSRLALMRALANNDQAGAGEINNDEPPISISRENIAAVRELGFLLDRSNQIAGLRQLLAAAEAADIERHELGYLWAAVALRDGRPEEAQRLLLQERPDVIGQPWYRMMIQIMDAIGNPEEAFAAAGEMNRAVPGYVEWRQRGATYRRGIRRTAQVVTPEWVSRIDPLPMEDDVPTPAFLVGFPRSGTTLLDTFLMGHPQISVVEEGRMLEKATGVFSESSQADWSRDLFPRARKAYMDELSRHVNSNFTGIIVDKHPLNMLRLAVIYALFPDAKVIFAQRHPVDVVLSGYMQSFHLNHAMASFLDLADAADFYDAAMTMWSRSRDAVPLEIHPVVFERLIADPAGELRPTVEFLGLDWHEELLDHQSTAKSRGSIMTASFDQVVKPLSGQPKGRWRRYRKQLEPVLPVLLPWAERLRYDE